MKNRSALYLLLASNLISGFAQGISVLAIPWHFTHERSGESEFGMAYMLITLVSLFWGLYAGTLIDRFSRKSVFLYLNLIAGTLISSIAFYGFYNGGLSDALIILVFAITLFVWNVHYPCLHAFGQEIMEPQHFGKFNSMLEVQGQATTILAGALGALLLNGVGDLPVDIAGYKTKLPFTIEKWSIQQVFLFDGITYFIGVLLIGSIRYIPKHRPETNSESMMTRFKEGITYLRSNGSVFLFGNTSFSIFVFLLVEVQLLMAWYVNNHLQAGADVYAGAEVYYAVGALFSGFAIRKIFSSVPAVDSVLFLMFFTSLVLIWASFTQNIWVFYFFSLFIGITNAGARVMRMTWLFGRIPNEIMGRAGGVLNAINIFQRMLLIGLFSLPFFSNGSNVTWAYFIGAVYIFINALLLLQRRRDLL